MRVAFVTMVPPQFRETAAGERARRTAELLAARGHDVTVLCSQWWEGHVTEFEQNDVTYRAVTEGPAPGSFASKVPFSLRKVGPDVIQAVNSPPGAVRSARLAGRVLRAPLVVDWWCDRPEDNVGSYPRAARAADVVVTPSRTIKTTVREHGADADDVRVIPESVDFDLVREAPVDERADIVYARDLDADANVEGFLLALGELRDRSWRAVVVGDGPARREAEEIAADLRIDDRVAFLGDLPAEERVPILKGAHVFAQTATREPFATDLLWGLACGCVGIVEYQADSAAHELVEGWERGRLVTDPPELADEIAAAAGLERRRIEEAFADYDHGAVLERYLDCYRRLLDDYGLF
jgi:glycosyltransferase involved in cell wall biosynthesis